MNELVGEIRNSIQYFASLPGRLPVSRVLVTGGGSALHGLIPLLEAQVRLPVISVSPLTRLDTSKLDLSIEQADEVSPVLSTPIGLALSEPDKSIKKFNLLPPEVAARARLKRIQQRTLVGCAAVLVLLVGFGAWKFLQVHNAQNQVSAAPVEHQHPQRPGAEVRRRGGGQQRLHSRSDPPSDGARTPPSTGRRRSTTSSRSRRPTPRCRRSRRSIGGSGHAPSAHARRPPRPRRRSAAQRATPTTSAAIGTIQLEVTGPGPSLSISEAWINVDLDVPALCQPAAGCDLGQPRLTDLLPLHHLHYPRCQPRQECEPEMSTVREYRITAAIAAGTLVVALLLWAILISPQKSKLTSLQTQENHAPGPTDRAEAKLAGLKADQQQLSTKCADLQTIATQIPRCRARPTSMPRSPRSRASSTGSLPRSGVTLTQFSGFAPATSTSAHPGDDRPRPAQSGQRGRRAHHPGGDRQLRPGPVLRERPGQLPPAVRHPELHPGLRHCRLDRGIRGQPRRPLRAASAGSLHRPFPRCGSVELRRRRRPLPTAWPSPGRSTTPRRPTPSTPAPRRPPRPPSSAQRAAV